MGIREDWDERRNSFGQVAELYFEVRPSYPDELFDDITSYARLSATSQLLEIGCGPGQATLPFAQRGFKILALELSSQMAAVAKENTRSFPNVEIANSSFEQYALEDDYIDLVFAASSFHWLEPKSAFPKIARVLHRGGALAVFGHRHVKSDPNDFFEAVQDVYVREVPEMARGHKGLADPKEIPPPPKELLETELFHDYEIQLYPWRMVLTSEQYVRLLSTFSDHITLPAEQKARLFAGIRELAGARFGGQVVRDQLTTLHLMRTAA